MNRCIIKYIYVDDADSIAGNDTDVLSRFERHVAMVSHSDFEELHAAVFFSCPEGFECMEPIALYHEVLWSMGLRAGKGRCVIERDELHHALEEKEYGLLKWSSTPPMSLCVDIVARGTHFF